MQHSIDSPNDWLRRAGARVDSSGKLVLPHSFLLVPMALASEAIVASRETDRLSTRLNHALTIAVNVRAADTAIYSAIGKMFASANPGQPEICHNCFRRSGMFGENMQKCRRDVNSQIIHKMEGSSGITMLPPETLDLAIGYYDEMFKLPLTNPFSWPETKIDLCKSCQERRASHGA